MLFKTETLRGIQDGTVTLAFRRWKRARVKAGTELRTAIGLVRVDAIDEVTLRAITTKAAKQSGYETRAALVADLDRYGDGTLYRLRLSRAGSDPRVALRNEVQVEPDALEGLAAKLRALGARSQDGPWGLAVLQLIALNESVRAGDLAPRVDMEVRQFKPRVRQLKELGLTESLEVGYRISPRGRALLRHLEE